LGDFCLCFTTFAFGYSQQQAGLYAQQQQQKAKGKEKVRPFCLFTLAVQQSKAKEGISCLLEK